MWSKGSVMFTKGGNRGCGLEKSKYLEIDELYIYIYAYVTGSLSVPGQMLLG